MKVLVTGAAGFIGSNLCDHLVELGHQVIALDDLSVGRRENLGAAEATGRLQFVEGSVLQLPALPWHEIEIVFHLAVACLRVCFERPLHVHEVNATGTLMVLEAARKSPVLKRFLYCSSSEVYGTALEAPMKEDHPLQPTTVYGASKLVGEIYTTSSGLPWTVARPFNTYGPREHHEGASGEVIPRFTVRILNGLSPMVFGDGQQTRDFTYVGDTARGLVAAATHPAAVGQILNLARGEEVSIARIARLLLDKTGRGDLAVEHRAARPQDVLRHFAGVEKARRLLGFEAGVAIEEGLERYLDWFGRYHPEIHRLLEEVQDRNW